jgi:alkaline phosphatase/streptomycin-6-phosphatase
MVFDAANLDAASGPRILGLFNAGNMSLKWTGLIAEPSPDSGLPTGQSCVENQRPANEPSLAAMTSKAIDLLHEDDGRAAGVYVQRFDRLGAKTGCLQRDRVRPGGDRSDV